MKEFTFSYDTKDKGISGSFTRALPTVEDLAEAIDLAQGQAIQAWGAVNPSLELSEAQELYLFKAAAVRVLTSYYWGWFRQVQVTLRAEAKRMREGNKSNTPLSAAEVEVRMAKGKMPVYAEPSETLTDEQKAEKTIAALNPAQLAALLAKFGISETKANG